MLDTAASLDLLLVLVSIVLLCCTIRVNAVQYSVCFVVCRASNILAPLTNVPVAVTFRQRCLVFVKHLWVFKDRLGLIGVCTGVAECGTKEGMGRGMSG